MFVVLFFIILALAVLMIALAIAACVFSIFFAVGLDYLCKKCGFAKNSYSITK